MFIIQATGGDCLEVSSHVRRHKARLETLAYYMVTLITIVKMLISATQDLNLTNQKITHALCPFEATKNLSGQLKREKAERPSH
jgi:hypothetical protein